MKNKYFKVMLNIINYGWLNGDTNTKTKYHIALYSKLFQLALIKKKFVIPNYI